ncbi:MAG: MlaD family protein [Mariprofundaceae bacterium]|nr:MlaD family protein [Mariprofundaceae bacterium]
MVDSLNFVSSIKRQVGWFVILGIGVLILVILIASMRSHVFAKKFYLFVAPPSASMFYEGQTVKFQGFGIGNIDRISLQDEGQVRVSLRLLERYRPMVHQGAVVQLMKEGLLGEQILILTQGDTSKPMLNDGAILAYEEEASLKQLITSLKPGVINANILLKELATLSLWMNDPYSDLRVSMAGLREISESVQGENVHLAMQSLTNTLQKLDAIVADLDEQKLPMQLADTLRRGTSILKNIEPLSKALASDGVETIQRSNDLLKHVNELSASMTVITTDLSEVSPELTAVARDSRATLKEMRALLLKLQNTWLVAGSSPKKKPKKLETAPPVLNLQP